MSRIQKYRESLYRFIKDKSCLMKNDDQTELNNCIYDKIKESDLIYSILLLTVMNNQNKKNNITMQGYYVASCIEFLNVFVKLIEDKETVSKFNIPIFNVLIMNANKSLQQNIETIKNCKWANPQNLVNIIINCLNIYNNSLFELNTFNEFKFVITNKNCDTDIIKWYLKTDNQLIEKFKTFKQVEKESLATYIEKKYNIISELSIIIGWIMGGGDAKTIKRLKKVSTYFSMMYKIAKDFENLTQDIKNNTDYTPNFVLNYGLQNAYESFVENKQNFIEGLMVEDIYTNTIKEVIDDIEANVDVIIDQTSPDLKSSYTTKSSKISKQN